MDSDFRISASLVVVWWHVSGRESGIQVKEAAATLSPRGQTPWGLDAADNRRGSEVSGLLTDEM